MTGTLSSPEVPALELRGVAKTYGSVRALDGVYIDLRVGEVHALIGENGAGKSTLVKVIAGMVHPDAGELCVDGRPTVVADRRAAARAGIGVVHQHFSLVDTFTVAENLQLGRPDAGARVALRDARRDLRAWSERTGLPVDPDALVETLTVGERQRVEILGALAWGARVLLLDEPTAVLSPPEADGLLDVVRTLAADGRAVLLVTHKLREVEAVADRVTVLRAGRVVGRHRAGDVTRDALAAEVIGDDRDTRTARPVRASSLGGDRLVVADLHAGRLHGVDLHVRAGEVVGVAGVAGNGQPDLVGAIAGLVAAQRGSVRIDGVAVHGDAGAACDAGVAYIPEDRAAEGLAAELPVWVNAVAKRQREVRGRFGLDRRRIAALTGHALARLGVRPADPDLPAAALSGGNQQRLVLGRELDSDPSVVVAAEPTRGLDPGSAIDVVAALRAAAAGGAAVLVTSSDLDELLMVADRIVVLYEGRITYEVERDAVERLDVGRAMVGAH